MPRHPAARPRRLNAARWSVALSLGLRQGEALGLTWRDIDLDDGILRVHRALQRRTWITAAARDAQTPACGNKRGADCPQRRDGGLLLAEPKTRASRRSVALPRRWSPNSAPTAPRSCE